MKNSDKRFSLIINCLPIIGIVSFVLLLIYSSQLYPGGSQINANTKGYDWINTYVCNLMGHKSLNGEINPGRVYAIFGMSVLCGSLIVFFFQFSKLIVADQKWSKAILIGGMFSMISAALIFTEFHNLMTTISSLFGLLVVVGIMREIYKSNLSFFKISGGVIIILLLINNLIYYTSYKIEHLPLIQKITFAIVLLWIIGLNYHIRQRIKISAV